MLRMLYRCLLRLHPRRFRQRFGEEMLWIFDQAIETRGTISLLADAGASLCRQWIFRSEFRREASATPRTLHTVPSFYVCESGTPRRLALLHGIVLTVGIFAALSFLMGHGGRYKAFLIGSHHPRHAYLLPVPASAVPKVELSAEVKVKPDDALRGHDPLRRFIASYFRRILVLAVLDANHDLIVSASELAAAEIALGQLDTDRDGKLTVNECLLGVLPPARTNPTQFMGLHPVLAALDANHDGEISAHEIQRARPALTNLDKNYNGALEPLEVLPEPVAFEAYIFLSSLDTNGDGAISKAERAANFSEMLAALLDQAGRNHDGIVTREELTKEIRRAADLNGDGLVTWEEMLAALRSELLFSKKPDGK